MATAKSRSLTPMVRPGHRNLIDRIRLLWTHILVAFIMEVPEEYAYHPDLEAYRKHNAAF